MGEEEVSDECLAALRAASEVIGEKCKFTPPSPAKTIEVEGAGQLRIPVEEAREAEKILEEKRELTKEEQFRVLKETWGKKVAAGTCTKYAGLTPDSEAWKTCVENVSEKLARGMMT
ncbi:hypothetical protein KAW18_17830 [candidate division WOR-3 bacterium]|nr:hypothetical protein [candidate division WOR-3 bacterium]